MSEQASVGKVRFQFEFNWKLTLTVVLMLPVLIQLGFWQLSRADEKQTLQEEWDRQQALPPIAVSAIDELEQADALGFAEGRQSDTPGAEVATTTFRRVTMRGIFEPSTYWLLENQTYNGRHGYNVLMPFNLEHGGVVLVNRGWLQGSGYRGEMPTVKTPSGTVYLLGVLAEPSQNVLLVNDESQSEGAWPRYTLQVDLDSMGKALGQTLGTQYLQLSYESDAAFSANWVPINMSAQKHIGYATQWFSMAFVLVVLTLFANSNLGRVLRRSTTSTD